MLCPILWFSFRALLLYYCIGLVATAHRPTRSQNCYRNSRVTAPSRLGRSTHYRYRPMITYEPNDHTVGRYVPGCSVDDAFSHFYCLHKQRRVQTPRCCNSIVTDTYAYRFRSVPCRRIQMFDCPAFAQACS
jgi:hypothetical protein